MTTATKPKSVFDRLADLAGEHAGIVGQMNGDKAAIATLDASINDANASILRGGVDPALVQEQVATFTAEKELLEARVAAVPAAVRQIEDETKRVREEGQAEFEALAEEKNRAAYEAKDAFVEAARVLLRSRSELVEADRNAGLNPFERAILRTHAKIGPGAKFPIEQRLREDVQLFGGELENISAVPSEVHAGILERSDARDARALAIHNAKTKPARAAV